MITQRKSIYIIISPFIAFFVYWFTTRVMAVVAMSSNRGDKLFVPELFVHWFSFFILGIFCCLPIFVLNYEKHMEKTVNGSLIFTSTILLFLFVAAYYGRYKLQVGLSFSVSLLFVSGNMLMAAFISPGKTGGSKVKTSIFYLMIAIFLLLMEMTIRLLVLNIMDNPQMLSVVKVIGILPYSSFIILGIVAISMLEKNDFKMQGYLFVVFLVITVLIDMMLIYQLFITHWFIIPGSFFSHLNQFFALYPGVARNIIFYFSGSYSTLLFIMVSNSKH